MVTKDEVEVLTLDHYLKLKAEGFEFEGQSYLFWEFMRLKIELNPKWYLLENVIMVEKWKNVLSRAIGVNPLRIDSTLMSAQTRDRYYWTNIYNEPQGFFGDMYCMIPQPKDKGIFLKDILEKNVEEKYFLKDNQLKWWEEHKEFKLKKQYSSLDSDKAITQTARQYASWNGNFVTETEAVGLREVRSEEGKEIRKKNRRMGKDYNPHRAKDVEERTDGKVGALLTSPTKDNLIKIKERKVKQLSTDNKSNGGVQPFQQDRVYDTEGIAPALCEHKSDLMIADGKISGEEIVNTRIRKLTPRECGRLQTFPEDKLDIIVGCGVSDSKLYKAFGNCWTCDVIVFILSFIK